MFRLLFSHLQVVVLCRLRNLLLVVFRCSWCCTLYCFCCGVSCFPWAGVRVTDSNLICKKWLSSSGPEVAGLSWAPLSTKAVVGAAIKRCDPCHYAHARISAFVVTLQTSVPTSLLPGVILILVWIIQHSLIRDQLNCTNGQFEHNSV
jgi:hypothetical protein